MDRVNALGGGPADDEVAIATVDYPSDAAARGSPSHLDLPQHPSDMAARRRVLSAASSHHDDEEHDEPVEPNSVKWKLAFMVREYKKLQEAFQILARAELERKKVNARLSADIARLRNEIDEANSDESSQYALRTSDAKSEQQFRADLQKERSRATLLRQDLNVLTQQHESLQARNAELTEKKSLFESSIERLQEKIAHLSQNVQGDGETTLATQLRAVETEKSDKAFRQLFGFGDAEFPIARYNCMNSKMMPGYLYLTPNYITFATTMFPKSNQVKILIKNLKQVKKARFAHLIDNSLKLVTVNGEKYAFSGFLKRNSCYKNICAQANKFKLDLGGML